MWPLAALRSRAVRAVDSLQAQVFSPLAQCHAGVAVSAWALGGMLSLLVALAGIAFYSCNSYSISTAWYVLGYSGLCLCQYCVYFGGCVVVVVLVRCVCMV